MKFAKSLGILVVAGLSAGAFGIQAADKAPKEKAKAYPLDKCVVTDEKFEGSEMKPYEFVHEGQTIKLCCKSCLRDFKKDTAKYLKKIETAQKAPDKK